MGIDQWKQTPDDMKAAFVCGAVGCPVAFTILSSPLRPWIATGLFLVMLAGVAGLAFGGRK